MTDGAFWCEDFFDTYMRDAQHELKARRYIENNPVKALLVREPKEWLWSSARFRTKMATYGFDRFVERESLNSQGIER